jgi:isopentenyl phosphate kinase
MTTQPELAFLKLGGSLITDKKRPASARLEVIEALAGQIAAVLDKPGRTGWLIGHGSGSFGHVPAQKFGTRQGVSDPEGWHGFAEVWRQANALNRIVIDALCGQQVPAVAFPPSSSVLASGGKIEKWDLTPLQAALEGGLIPVVFGDVAFDRQRGGTIVSTEEVFSFLAGRLQPSRILIAGIEAGVWQDYPRRSRLFERITPQIFASSAVGIAGSAATDVTGGMASKVQEMLTLAGRSPGLEVRIFDGRPQGNLSRAMAGEPLGTLITQGGNYG